MSKKNGAFWFLRAFVTDWGEGWSYFFLYSVRDCSFTVLVRQILFSRLAWLEGTVHVLTILLFLFRPLSNVGEKCFLLNLHQDQERGNGFFCFYRGPLPGFYHAK